MSDVPFQMLHILATRLALEGWRAHKDGIPVERCPYRDDGSRVADFYVKAWRAGWEKAGYSWAEGPPDTRTPGGARETPRT